MKAEVVKKTLPLLTIAIPTYNRASHLELCLIRLKEELESLTDDQKTLVEVYVSNNASTDNTANIISQYLGKIGGVFNVVHNKENIGGECNVTQCFESNATPYVWILGDDDVILPNGLKKVLDVLLQQTPDLLFLGNYHFLDDYLDTRYAPRKKKVAVSNYSDPFQFVSRTNVMLTFISGLVVRNRETFEYNTDVAKGSNIPQLAWVLPLLRDGVRFSIIEDFIVAAKGANSGGYGLIEVFGENLQKISKNILKEKPKLARVIQNGTIVNFFPNFILEFRKGSDDFTDENMTVGLKDAFGDNWRYYVFLMPLLLLPLPIAQVYNIFLRAIRRLFYSLLV